MVLWMFITAQLLWAYGVTDVHYCSTAVDMWCYGCSLLLSCCGHMVLRVLGMSITAQLLWVYLYGVNGCLLLLSCCGHIALRMFITSQPLWAYGVTNVYYCSAAVGIWRYGCSLLLN
jgi:hypothetical protein